MIKLVFKALDGCDKLLRRSAAKADAKVDANRRKSNELLIAHSNRVDNLKQQIASEESKYALAAMDLSFDNVDLRKHSVRALKLAGAITQLTKEVV